MTDYFNSSPSLEYTMTEVLDNLELPHQLIKSTTRRTLERHASRPTQDAADVLDLPYAMVNDDADLEEYIQETAAGIIPKRTISRVSGHKVDHQLVTFTLEDRENPKNWSKLFKWYCTMVVALTCLVVAFSSSVITADLVGPTVAFNTSHEIVLVTITVFVVGFGIGPLVFAPLSELFGRKPIYVVTLGVAVVLVIPCATAGSIGTLIACRLLDGIAFSAPMTLVGGTLADLWDSKVRAVPMAVFSAAPFLGPAIGPLVGGYLAVGAGWRWLYWIQLILSGVCWILLTFTVPETYTPTILKQRATRLRKETGDMSFTTEIELDPRPFSERLRIFLIRPLQLLFLEPIVLFVAIYMSILYGLLYMFFIAYPIVYQGGKGWAPGPTGLMFIPIAIGVVCSAFCAPFVNKHYLSLCAKAPNGTPAAEARLIPMMFSCWLIPIGLFIFAWTSYPQISYWGPMIGGFPVGFGFIFLYNSANNYLVDTYQHQAASALAAKTFLRSLWGASTVLFTEQMYKAMGDQWASSFLAFLSLLCCLIPFVFYYKGAAIRKHSKYAFSDLADEKAVTGESKV